MKLRMKHSFYLFNEIDSLPDFLIIFNLKKISVVNLQLFYYYSLFHAFHNSGNIAPASSAIVMTVFEGHCFVVLRTETLITDSWRCFYGLHIFLSSVRLNVEK